MFQPRTSVVTIPPMVSVFTKGIGWVDESITAAAPGSGGWSGTDWAYYYPIALPASCTLRRVWWANGSNVAGAALIEVGVYADDGEQKPGALVVSASATQSGASSVQFADPTDTALASGLYWLAIHSDTTTDTTIFRATIEGAFNAVYGYRQSGLTSGLPSTATPVETTGNDAKLIGFSTVASP